MILFHYVLMQVCHHQLQEWIASFALWRYYRELMMVMLMMMIMMMQMTMMMLIIMMIIHAICASSKVTTATAPAAIISCIFCTLQPELLKSTDQHQLYNNTFCSISCSFFSSNQHQHYKPLCKQSRWKVQISISFIILRNISSQLKHSFYWCIS